MDETRLKKDWLAGSALTSFLGALMLAQAWRTTGSDSELPFNITVPAFPDPMSFTIGAVLFLSSFLLAVGSLIPIRLVPAWVVPVVSKFSAVLDLLVWLAFLQSWSTIVSELPDDQWWASAFVWGGLVILFFLGFRFFAGMFRVASQSNRKPWAISGGLMQWTPSLQTLLRQWFTRGHMRMLCCALFFVPFTLYLLREWSQLPDRPLALDVGVVTVAAALGGLVLNAGLNLQGSKRKETVQVAQKFIWVVILFVIFLPAIHFVELMGGIELGSFKPVSVEAWFRGFFFWIAAASFYAGIGFFIFALVDLVYAIRDIHNVKYASSGNPRAPAENDPCGTVSDSGDQEQTQEGILTEKDDCNG